MKYLITTIALLLFVAQTVMAQSVSVEVTIQSVKPEAKEITVGYKTNLGDKSITLDVSRKAEITLNGEQTTLESLGPGLTATVEYHKELEIVTRIVATGDITGWKFIDMSGKCDPKTACTVKDDILICSNQAGYCLVSNQAFDAVVFKVEFCFPSSNKISKNGGSIIVAGIEPNLQSSDWIERMPRGFEIKLAPGQGGEVLLPIAKDYPKDQVKLPLGQLRDDRRITRLRDKDLPVGEWNELEIEYAVNGNLTVKLNGELVNGMQNAKPIGGKIFLWPLGSELHFKNPIVVVDGVEKKLDFVIQP